MCILRETNDSVPYKLMCHVLFVAYDMHFLRASFSEYFFPYTLEVLVSVGVFVCCLVVELVVSAWM